MKLSSNKCSRANSKMKSHADVGNNMDIENGAEDVK